MQLGREFFTRDFSACLISLMIVLSFDFVFLYFVCFCWFFVCLFFLGFFVCSVFFGFLVCFSSFFLFVCFSWVFACSVFLVFVVCLCFIGFSFVWFYLCFVCSFLDLCFVLRDSAFVLNFWFFLSFKFDFVQCDSELSAFNLHTKQPLQP